MKWNTNDVNFNRGNYRPVIAKFDNSKCWLRIPAMTTTSSARSTFRKLGEYYNSEFVEVKYFYNDNDERTESNVVDFLNICSRYIFRNELDVESGCQRQFKKYEESDIFEMTYSHD